MPTETKRRVAANVALLASFQSGKGSVVANFSAARNLWASPVMQDLGLLETNPRWMTTRAFDSATSYIRKTRKPFGRFRSILTPQTAEFLLRSNWGPASGQTFTLATAVSEWLSLVYVEDRTSGADGRALRLTDAWLYRLAFRAAKGDLLRCEAEWAARREDVFDLTDPALTLPAPPMGPANSSRFAWRQITLTRDPAGAAETFGPQDFELEIDQGLIHEWTLTSGIDVRKGGKTLVRFRFLLRVNDESWGLIDRALADTHQAWRIEARNVNSSLRFDFASVNLAVQDFGTEQKNLKRIGIEGTAELDSLGNGVTITLVP